MTLNLHWALFLFPFSVPVRILCFSPWKSQGRTAYPLTPGELATCLHAVVTLHATLVESETTFRLLAASSTLGFFPEIRCLLSEAEMHISSLGVNLENRRGWGLLGPQLASAALWEGPPQLLQLFLELMSINKRVIQPQSWLARRNGPRRNCFDSTKLSFSNLTSLHVLTFSASAFQESIIVVKSNYPSLFKVLFMNICESFA